MIEEVATPFFTTYGAVLVAEIAGDKLLYTTGVLATRFRALPIVSGVSIACVLKMACAVFLGSAISRIPPVWLALITLSSFGSIALVLFRAPPLATLPQGHVETPRALMLSFLAVLFSEWGDVGQITAAAMAARFGSPIVVWLGAVSALITKGAIGALVGARLRTWVKGRQLPHVARVLGATAMLLIGLFSAFEMINRPA